MGGAIWRKAGATGGRKASGFKPSLLFLLHRFLKSRRMILLLGAACVLKASMTLFIVEKGYFSAMCHYDRDMHAEDHKFLDNLAQKQNQVDSPDTDLLAAAAENVPKAGMNGSGDGPAPRAELVVNNKIVKRAEPVNRGGTVKRAGLVRRR
jgi:hypothetical protein